jgi:heterotetrameric sarcosine oxidase gamma subunit
MAELQRGSPLAAYRTTNRPGLPVGLLALPPSARIAIRAGPEALPALAQAFGVAFPQIACRAMVSNDRAALWLGPDEWLFIAPETSGAEPLPATTAALAGTPASLVDVSHRTVAIEVTGPSAAAALNAFVPLDLDDAAFPVGSCTRTLLGKAEILLWRTSFLDYRLEVARSFSAYVWRLLEEASRQYLVE